jgi:hypothetical protein
VRLSEALLMLGMTKPQGFGNEGLISVDTPCAIGGALQIIGRQPEDLMPAYRIFREAWPWTEKMTVCPVCQHERTDQIKSIIWHLNDLHEWTRAQIAEWVASIEPREEEESVEVIEEVIHATV